MMEDVKDEVLVRRATDRIETAPLTVTEITGKIKDLFESTPAFRNVSMLGEISNFKHHQGRHMYFSLKDAGAQMKCAFFSPANRSIAFVPSDGMEVIVTGSISVYPQTGAYQFYVKLMKESGAGALYKKYDELRKKLIAEGLTDSSRKRPLPRYPERIGIVASSESAGLRDILNVLARRYPLATVVTESVAVEGEASAPSIVKGLDRMARYGNADVVIVGRGGGSIESLWGFNTEIVARAIAAMPVPVVSAIGHETDTTIADLVADRRAATPTEAAELITPSIEDIRAFVADRRVCAVRCIGKKLRGIEERVRLVSRTLRSPEPALNFRAQRLDHLAETLALFPASALARRSRTVALLEKRLLARAPLRVMVETAGRLNSLAGKIERRLTDRRSKLGQRLALAEARLASANPTAILERGYAIAMKDGKTLKISSDVAVDELIDVKLYKGEIRCQVKKRVEA